MGQESLRKKQHLDTELYISDWEVLVHDNQVFFGNLWGGGGSNTNTGESRMHQTQCINYT